MPKDWKGDIVFSHSVAIFRGRVGDNKAHSHWASQITIALEGELEFETASGLFKSKAAYFVSKTKHRLLSGFICSIYFDPLCESIVHSLNSQTKNGCLALSEQELPAALASIKADTDLRELINSGALGASDLSTQVDERFKTVLQALKSHMRKGEEIDRDALAALVNLSPTRFSHWFVERSGIPLRSYKKWLKLRVAMDALLNGQSLIDAALQAGFSDMAHMSRAFSESFGITYVDAQRALELSKQY